VDSRIIFEKSEYLKFKVIWPKITDSEWIYFGAGKDVNYDIVLRQFEFHFSTAALFISFNRINSFETNIKMAKVTLEHLIGKENFIAWDDSFTKAIEFNNIGVLRCGQIPKA
jgi:hypothetical protein